MTALVLALLAAAPTAAAWRVTFSTSSGTDHGNGRIVATHDFTFTVTPTEMKTDTNGKAGTPEPTPPDLRERINELLAQLPTGPATYSLSRDVNDEGWYSERLVVVRGKKEVAFDLVQGPGAPLPAPVEKLKQLMAKMAR